METLVKKFKKNSTSQLLIKVGNLTGIEKDACLVVLKERNQDVTKWEIPEVKKIVKPVSSAGKVIMEFEDETPLTKEEKKLLSDFEKGEKKNHSVSSEKKKETPAANLKETLTNLVYPEGFTKGTMVTFLASKSSKTPGAKLSGKIKRYYFDKQDQAYYFIVDVDGKDMCKRPTAVTKI